MLSISNVSIAQASTYYSKDNYYTKERGEFTGKAVQKLGFTEELTHDNFIKMLHGQNSTGENLRRAKETGETRAGYDHTFSSPKSVSVLLEIAEAKNNELGMQLRKAHDRAVNAALKHIEDNYIYTRVRQDGDRKQVKTSNMIVAKFEHDTSRELDPALHTHCVIANLTQLPNGKWQSISNEKLYDNKILNGQIYRSELARELKNLDLDIEITDSKKMFFEIKGVDKSLLNEFSKRSEQIKEKIEKLREKYPNASEAELKQFATLESRKVKTDVDRDKVRVENLQRAEKLIDTDKLLKNIKQENIKFQNINIKELIEKTAEIITETESVFSKEEILKIATKLSLGDVKASHIWREIENTELIKIDNNQFTTKEILKKEKEIIEYLHSTQNSKKQISTQEKAKGYIEKNYETMTTGQKEAFTHIIQSTDALIGIQGDAGSGKTYMLKALNEFTQDKNTELIGLAYTGQASDELEKNSGIKSTTLHSYLAKKADNEEEKKSNKIYIVDEASLVGSKQLHQLIQKAKKENSKIVLIGDTKQFQTISAGAIFDQLQQRGMLTAEMEENIRQRDSKTLREIVKEIKDKNTDKAFQILKDTNAISETSMLHKEAVQEYKKDDKALIIASTNKDRKEINQQIRDLKIKRDELKNEKSYKVKESVNVLAEQKFFINNYEVGQLAFINKSANSLKAGQQAKITNIDKEQNLLTLSFKNKGKITTKTVDVRKVGDQLSIYKEKNIKLAPGEKITFSKNDKKLGVKNGNIAIITKLDKEGNITAKMEDKEVSFNLRQYNYIDYGYAITDFKAQGQTASNVIIVANSQMANINSFYVQVTRAKKRVKILTDNMQRLQKNITKEEMKSTTLDYVSQKIKQAKEEIGELKPSLLKRIIEKIKEKLQINKEKENGKLIDRVAQRANQSELTNGAAAKRDDRFAISSNRDDATTTRRGRTRDSELERADSKGAAKSKSPAGDDIRAAIKIAEDAARKQQIQQQNKGAER